MKQVKILFLVLFSLLSLIAVSCMPGGTQPAKGWPGTAFHNGVVYTGTSGGEAVAVNSSARNLQWSYLIAVPSSGGIMSCGQAPVSAAIYGAPAAAEDLAYVGTYSGKVLALSTSARSQDLSFPQQRYGEWEWDCPGEDALNNGIVAGLVIEGDAIYLTSSNGRVYSLDKEFGDLNWESEIIDEEYKKLWASPVIHGDSIYVSTFAGYVYTLSIKTGDLLPWAFKSEDGFVSAPAIYEDTLFVGSFQNSLYAIEIGSSEPLWIFPGGKWFWATPVVHDGVVYAGCLDGKIYAVRSRTGEKIWEFEAGSPIVSSPVLMDDLLLVADESGNLYVFALDAKPVDNEAIPLRTIQINAPVKGSFCAQEGMAYVRAQNNRLYTLDIENGRINWELPLAIE